MTGVTGPKVIGGDHPGPRCGKLVSVVRTRDDWATSVVLADGETGYLRAMSPADAPALLAFHERQPRENLYRRFFSPKPTPRTRRG